MDVFPRGKPGKMEFFMKIPVAISAERVSVVKTDPGCGSIPRSRIFEISLNRGPEAMRKDHALIHRVRT
jgi:hypothetical protein